MEEGSLVIWVTVEIKAIVDHGVDLWKEVVDVEEVVGTWRRLGAAVIGDGQDQTEGRDIEDGDEDSRRGSGRRWRDWVRKLVRSGVGKE